jgi:hypothetical protein
MRAGSPRIVFATPLMRAAFAGDLELVKLLPSYGADPRIVSKDGETMVSAAAGLGFSQGYSKGKPEADAGACCRPPGGRHHRRPRSHVISSPDGWPDPGQPPGR